MTRWILPITGFTEGEARPTGIERLWGEMRQYATRGCVVLTPRRWSDDMLGLAMFLRRNSEGRAVVCVVAYSWGAGVGFIEFAKYAEILGITIVVAVLADPVYRSRWLPWWIPFNPRSVMPWLRPVIRVPASVRNVRWVRQDATTPRGHDLIAIDETFTYVEPGIVLRHSHARIDESREFRALAMGAVEEFSSLRGGQ